MKTTHTIAATYPLAGSEDGLPVEITFTYEQRSRRWNASALPPEPFISFASAKPLCADRLPEVIQNAITAWAEEWLDDHGFDRAWDAALDDIERQRESARDMGMRA